MTSPSEEKARCAGALQKLVESLREAAPRLNDELPFPQRMAITDVRAGDVDQTSERRCRVTLSLQAGSVSKSYQVELTCVTRPLRLTVQSGSDFEEQIELTTSLDETPTARDVERFYDALATDIAGHFGADS